jgi:hypothetical protein
LQLLLHEVLRTRDEIFELMQRELELGVVQPNTYMI